MTSDLPMRHRYVIANKATRPEALYLGHSEDLSAYKWVRSGPLKDVLLFDELAEAVEFSRSIPRESDVEPEVVYAWMPSVNEVLNALGVPEDRRDDVRTLRDAIGRLWVGGVLNVEKGRDAIHDLLEASKLALEVSHRLSGCSEEGCKVCEENKTAVGKLKAAIGKAERHLSVERVTA